MLSLKKMIEHITADLQKDPRNKEYPFTQKVVEWINKLTPSPSEALLLAAWGHTLQRWAIERKTYPMNPKGYHQWRKVLSELSAKETESILKSENYPEEIIHRVKELILKTTFPKDPESRVLEDADCLAFLELKFESYISEWDETKYIRILQGTLEKMTPQAQEFAKKLSYSPEAQALLNKALET